MLRKGGSSFPMVDNEPLKPASRAGDYAPRNSLRHAVRLPAAILWLTVSIAHAQQVPQQRGLPSGDSLVRVGEDRAVIINTRGLATIEPHLVADAREPNHLLAGVFLVAKLGDPRNPNFAMDLSCAALDSRDAGLTWVRRDFAQRGCGDPWVALVGGGAVFLGLTRGQVFALRSADGGRTWADSAVSLGSGDHGTLAVDMTGGPFTGSIYAVWWRHVRDDRGASRSPVFVARSADGGATFSSPTRIMPWSVGSVAMNPVVLSDGALIVPFNSFLPKSSPTWVVTSSDGGRTFSVPLLVTDICDRSFSQLGVDASPGPYRDRLYSVCSDSTHIYLLHSSDRGETWSDPLVVNRGPGPVHNPVIAVNRHGVVAISWYDAREDPRSYRDSFRCQHVFFAASLDGGSSVLPDVKVSSAENCPDTPSNGEAGRRWKAGGDYHGLAASADGRFHLLWADSREGIYQLRTAYVQVNREAEVAR
jgi:hypothetical protein